MLAWKFFLVILSISLFASVAILVAYDVFAAARLRWLLTQTSNQGGAEVITPRMGRPFAPSRGKPVSQLTRATSYEHRPVALWVARAATLEERP
jgi:hypothetical protein